MTLIRHYALLLLGLFVVFLIGLSVTVVPANAQDAKLSKLEQQINIINGEFSSPSTIDTPADNSLGLIYFDSNNYTSGAVYFEVVARCDNCNGGNERMSVSLYNDTGVVQTTLNVTGDTYSRYRSGSLILPTDEYTIRFKLDASTGTAYVKSARLIINQGTTTLTHTQTQVEIGSYTSNNDTVATQIESPKLYRYNHSLFSGTVASYFEASFRTSNNEVTTNYYYDSHDFGGEEWTSNPGAMDDNNTGTYASTSTNGQVQRLTANVATPDDRGEITKVEIRAHGYQTNGSDGSVYLRSVFGGTSDGSNFTFNLPEDSGNANWSSYFDITSDTNAPAGWTWSDVDDLDLDVQFNKGASGSNTAFVSSVEVRVTYKDNDVVAYVSLVNKTNNEVVTTLSTSNNVMARYRSNALTTNWDLINPDDYEVRAYTSDANNHYYLSNAKIIIDQVDGGGLTSTEVVHQMINIERSQSNSVYTQDAFINNYNQSNFAGSNVLRTFYEVTIRTSDGTAYSALYNTNAGEIIDLPNNSEVTTTSTLPSRVRSDNLSLNTDWPLYQSDLTPIIKATDGEIAYVSNAVLIIQTRMMLPELTFTISPVAASQTYNGITTTAESTITSLPFGHLTALSPRFAAHQLTVVTNDAVTGYSVYTSLVSELQGTYPLNNIDPFTGGGAVWTNPQPWNTPTGTTPNQDTGWFGANTTDSNVNGWSNNTQGKFGPVSTTPVEVMRSNLPDVDDTQVVSYGIEVNVLQPADTYSSVLQYNILPRF